MIKPSVITSRPADAHYQNIISQHSEIVRGLSLQSQKVAQINQQKDAERQAQLQNQLSIESEMKQAEMVANTAQQKNALDFATQQGELDIKRAALAQT